MPGYTHLQRAVPSSIGLWMGSFVEGFLDSAELCALTRRWIDASPLGTAAGYGVNIDLPRQQVSDELGFSRIQINPMSAQSSRGRVEHQVVATLWQTMQEASACPCPSSTPRSADSRGTARSSRPGSSGS